jgi:peptidyl-prolyl cis-trans isomerase NIMA-interacting 4
MAPKGKGGDKGKAAGKDTADKDKGGKSKGAQTINVRHIMTEKHAKKEEALAKLNVGAKFDDVAREFSEDKARTGTFVSTLATFTCLPLSFADV